MVDTAPPLQVEWLGAGLGAPPGELGCVDYRATLVAMQRHAAQRQPGDADRLWLCTHAPVYTLGLSGRAAHVHAPGSVPVVETDRGGQVTYHGPGQVVAYPLVDLRRLGLGVKEYVHRLEHCVIRTLEAHGVTGHRVRGAPGVYVVADDPASHRVLARSYADDGIAAFSGLAKVAALGVRIGRNCAYHGVALNVAMDLSPYGRIDPCGHAGLQTTDLATLGVETTQAVVAAGLAGCLVLHLQR